MLSKPSRFNGLLSPVFSAPKNFRLTKIESGKWLKLAKHGNELLGFISYKPEGIGGMSAISLLCVASNHKRSGIGGMLLKHAEGHIFSYDHNVMLFVTSFNAEAISFYEKHGYKRVGEIENYNFIGQSEYLYRKTLGPRREGLICPNPRH